MFTCGEVTAGQPLDLEAEISHSFLREIDLPVLKGVFVASANQERELIAIGLEELTEIEPIALRLVIRHEARCRREVEHAVVAIHGVKELTDLAIRHRIVFGPYLPRPYLEQGEGKSQTTASEAGETAQQRRGVPWVAVPVRKEPTIEDENTAYVRPARAFTLL